MVRKARVEIEGGVYHVYNRFARGADLFADPEEAIEFLELLRKVRDRDGLTVFAWTQRYLIAALGIERWGIKAKSLARLVGRLPEAVSRWGSRGAEMRQQSEDFKESYENLDRRLATLHDSREQP